MNSVVAAAAVRVYAITAPAENSPQTSFLLATVRFSLAPPTPDFIRPILHICDFDRRIRCQPIFMGTESWENMFGVLPQDLLARSVWWNLSYRSLYGEIVENMLNVEKGYCSSHVLEVYMGRNGHLVHR